MTIVVRRAAGSFGRWNRFRVVLDGVTVGRVRRGRAVEVTGTGAPQRLAASINGLQSDELVVTDPGPDAVLEIVLTDRGLLQGTLRTLLAPRTVLVLVPAGEPVPAPPPLRLDPRRVALLWVAFTTLQVLSIAPNGIRNGTLGPKDLLYMALSSGLIFALILATATLLRHRSGRR